MTHRLLLLLGPLCIALFTLACDPAAEQSTSPMATEADPGMTHTVYFWLQDSLTADDRTAFEEGMRSLAAAPSVDRLFVGKPAATPSRGVVDNSFDYSLVLWFADVAAHDAYQVSEVHQKFVADHEAKFREVRVYDHDRLE